MFFKIGKSKKSAAAAKKLENKQKNHNNNNNSRITNCHLGILNSASGKSPGGLFFKGTVSPEDCICRATLLYPCLEQFEHEEHHFYVVNNKAKYKESSSACAIFSPRVPVIREDTMIGELLSSYCTYSFVSLPAPNAFIVGRNSDSDSSSKSSSSTEQHDKQEERKERNNTSNNNHNNIEKVNNRRGNTCPEPRAREKRIKII